VFFARQGGEVLELADIHGEIVSTLTGAQSSRQRSILANDRHEAHISAHE
jgi:hypothetical protein